MQCNVLYVFLADSVINLCAQCNIQVHSLDVFRAHKVEQIIIKVSKGLICFLLIYVTIYQAIVRLNPSGNRILKKKRSVARIVS